MNQTSKRQAGPSKLEPFTDLIRELRLRRKSYCQIASILREQHGLIVDRSTIWSFVKVRSKRRKVFTMTEDGSQIKPVLAKGFDPIAALKAKPVPTAKPPLFVFDENQPLTLIKTHE